MFHFRWLDLELFTFWISELWAWRFWLLYMTVLDLSFTLKEGADRIVWSLQENKRFSVTSVYNAITSNDAGNLSQEHLERENPCKNQDFFHCSWQMMQFWPKTIFSREIEKVTPLVISATIQKISHISFFNVAWQKQFGLWWPNALEQILFLGIWINVGNGVISGYLSTRSIMFEE